MNRTAGIIIIIIVAFLLFAGVRLYQRRPRIEILHVEWLTKKVKYKVVAGRTEQAGTLANGGGDSKDCGNDYCIDAIWSDSNKALFLIKDRNKHLVQKVKVDFLRNRIERKEFSNPVPIWNTAFA